MYEKWKKNDMAEKHFIVTERLRRRQQKIARFECIQLFFSSGNCVNMTSSNIRPVGRSGVKTVEIRLLTHQLITAWRRLRNNSTPINSEVFSESSSSSSPPLLSTMLANKHEERFFSCFANAWIKWCDIIALNVSFFIFFCFVLSHDHHKARKRNREFKWKLHTRGREWKSCTKFGECHDAQTKTRPIWSSCFRIFFSMHAIFFRKGSNDEKNNNSRMWHWHLGENVNMRH